MAVATAPSPEQDIEAPDGLDHQDADEAWKAKTNPWVIALTVTLATFMEVLDSSIANVSLPHIGGALGATQNEAAWVLTSYLVANAIVLPAAAYLTTFIGRKRFYMICVALFGFSSMLCGVAPSLSLLIFFRVLQGAGGGGLAPSEQAILADTFSPKQRGQAFALYGVAVVMAPAIGPLLGGWITDNFTWRWIFWINVPVTLLSLFLVNRLIEDPPNLKREVVKAKVSGAMPDLLGFGLLALGFGSLEFVLDKGQEDDWFASHVILFFVILCVASLATLLAWELYQSKINKRPIINLTLFKRKTFAIPFVFMFVLGFMFYSTLVLIPQYAQTLLGYSAVLAGEVISPGGFALLLTMPVAGFLITKVDARWLMCFGFFTLSTAMFLMHTISLESSFRYIMWIRIYQMAGLSFFFIPINTVAYLGVAKGENNDVSGLINLARNIGGSVGTAFVGTMLARGSQEHQAYMVSHATPTSPGLVAQMARLKPLFHGNVQAAYGYIYIELQRQSAMLAYLDIIAVIAVMCALAAPLVFLLGKMQPPKDGPAMH